VQQGERRSPVEVTLRRTTPHADIGHRLRLPHRAHDTFSPATRQKATVKRIPVQGVHYTIIVGSTKQSAIDFWSGVLGMPFVLEQPNLGMPDENHLYFDPSRSSRGTVMGWILFAERRPLDAVMAFRSDQLAPDGPAGLSPIAADAEVGLAFERAGRPDSAIVAYEHYVNTPDPDRFPKTGSSSRGSSSASPCCTRRRAGVERREMRTRGSSTSGETPTRNCNQE